MAADRVARYILAETATDDLNRIVRYIGFHNPAAAVKITQRFLKVFERLAFSPQAGRQRPEFSAHLRSFPLTPYTVFYHVTPEGVAIDRILHGARDITPDFFDPDAA